MTSQEPTTPLEVELTERVEQLRVALRQQNEQHIAAYEDWDRMLTSRPTQDQLDQALADRNTARQNLAEVEQERQRLYDVLAETVAGVQSWVPDLSPVPQPPASLPVSAHEAWIQDQIAQRRQEWDVFVNRVVTQAGV